MENEPAFTVEADGTITLGTNEGTEWLNLAYYSLLRTFTD